MDKKRYAHMNEDFNEKDEFAESMILICQNKKWI